MVNVVDLIVRGPRTTEGWSTVSQPTQHRHSPAAEVGFWQVTTEHGDL